MSFKNDAPFNIQESKKDISNPKSYLLKMDLICVLNQVWHREDFSNYALSRASWNSVLVSNANGNGLKTAKTKLWSINVHKRILRLSVDQKCKLWDCAARAPSFCTSATCKRR